MAPIRRQRGVSYGFQHPSDDPLALYFEELNSYIDDHVQEMHACIERLNTHLHHAEPEMQKKSQSVAAGEGSSQAPATRVQRELLSCLTCKTLLATMVCYPCGHLCVCLECDTKNSKCPMCNNHKLSSFMADLSA